MNIENVSAFLAVYREGNFTQAAKSLYITQPSLSSRVQTLERDLGVTLLVRHRGQVTLTEDGKLFLPYALQMINAYRQACAALGKGKQHIRIGTHISVSAGLLPPILKKYKERNHQVVIDIFTGLPENLLHSLLERSCDFLITQELDHPSVEMIPVYQDPVSLIVPAGHPFLKRMQPPTIDEVALEPLIRSTTQQKYWEQIDAYFSSHNITPNVILSIDSLEVIKNMVLQGIGIAFLPELPLRSELLNHELFSLNTTAPMKIHRDISIVYRKEDKPSCVDAFAALMKAYSPLPPTP